LTQAKLQHYLESLRKVVNFSETLQIKKGTDGSIIFIRSATVNRNYVNGKIHGPSVDFFGTTLYFWNGILIPKEFWTSKDSVTIQDVFDQKNIETRRACLEIYGIDKIKELPQYKLIHKDNKTGAELFDFMLDEKFGPIRYIKVYNSTPEPDGTKKVYHICVPNSIEFKTCREALAWTFSATVYDPLIET